MSNKLPKHSYIYASIALLGLCLSALIGWAGIDFGQYVDELFHPARRHRMWKEIDK